MVSSESYHTPRNVGTITINKAGPLGHRCGCILARWAGPLLRPRVVGSTWSVWPLNSYYTNICSLLGYQADTVPALREDETLTFNLTSVFVSVFLNNINPVFCLLFRLLKITLTSVFSTEAVVPLGSAALICWNLHAKRQMICKFTSWSYMVETHTSAPTLQWYQMKISLYVRNIWKFR